MDCIADRRLNRLLRMAVLAGVEAAVRIHVQRGDDLDARDGDGMTPLMLAASKNKAAICSLLLGSGADASLKDSLGRDALEIAKASGATAAAAVLSAPEQGSKAKESDSAVFREEQGVHQQAPGSIPSPRAEEPERISAEDNIFHDLSEWEPEEDGPPPEGDETLSVAAAAAHMAISGHRPIDTSEDWEDFEAFLPEHALPLSRAGDEERRERIRRLLTQALCEGSVPEAEVEALCANIDGTRNPESEALLILALGDLGTETDERIESDSFPLDSDDDSNAGEDAEISEALAFLDDLGSGRNEPIRIYVREMSRRKLLRAEEELALARDIDEGDALVLDALASWPDGVASVLAAAGRVRVGDAEAEEMSTGGGHDLSGNDGEQAAEPEVVETENGEESFETAACLSEGTTDFLERVAEVERLRMHAGKGNAGEKALRDALALVNLSRAFLLGLANGVKDKTDAASRFAIAIKRQAAARERLAVCNLRLALSIAKRYQGWGLPLDDLVQEANIGLLKAVDRFDWRRGFRFSTYATWWIRQQVTRALADKGKMIRMPVHVHDLMNQLAREAESIENTTGRRPTAEALAKRLNIAPRKISALLDRMEEPVPLHEPDADGIVPADALADLAATDPAETAEKAELSALIGKLLTELGPKPAEIIAMRFGLGDEAPRTLEEVGEIHGVTRERIRQIEAKSLKKLRHPSRSELLRDFIDLSSQTSDDEHAADTVEGTNPDKGDDQPNESTRRVNGADLRPEKLADCEDEQGSDAAGRPESKAIERVLAMARAQGFRVEDTREDGGEISLTLGNRSDGVARTLARTLMNAGFKVWPGRVFRK